MSEGERIRVECHQCGKVMRAPVSAIGRTAKCTNCGASIKIEAPSEPGAEDSAPPPLPSEAPPPTPSRTPRRTPRRTGAGQRFRERKEAQARVQRGERTGLAFGAAVGAAILFAFLWFGVTTLLDSEPALAAPLVGVGIAGAALYVGGRGYGIAAASMFLAVASLVFGRYLVLDHLIDAMVRDEVVGVEAPVEEDYRETYDRLRSSAPSWKLAGIDTRKLSQQDERRLKQFLIEHGFEQAPESGIRFPQIARFVREDEPQLRDFAADPPSFDDWYYDQTADYRDLVERRNARIEQEKEEVDLMFLLQVTFIVDKLWTLLVTGAAAAAFGFVAYWTQRDVRLAGKEFDEKGSQSA